MLETKTRDEEINDLIEEEHATGSKHKVNVQYAAPEEQELVSKKMKDKNQVAMSVKFELEAIKFVDLTGFNNSTCKPNEVVGKLKEFINKNLNEKLPEIAKDLQLKIEENGCHVFKVNVASKPFDGLAYSMEAMLMKSLHGDI